MRSPFIRAAATAVACALLLSGCKDDEQQSNASESNASGENSSSSRDGKDTESGSKNTSKEDDSKDRDDRDSDKSDRDSDKSDRDSDKSDRDSDKSDRDGGKSDRDSDARDRLREVYRSILKNPTQVPPNFYNEARTPNGKYSYTLADIDDDGLPEMLLNIGSKAAGWDDMSIVAVIMGTSTPGHVVIDKERFYFGATTAGGHRASTFVPAPGHTGVFDLYWRSVYPEVQIRKYEVSGGKLVKTREYQDEIQGLTIPGACVADWLPVSDSSRVDTLSAQQCRPEEETPPASRRDSSDDGAKKKDDTRDAGSTGDTDSQESSSSLVTTTNVGPQKIRGTVRTYKGYELTTRPAYGEDPNISYVVLDFDNPPQLTCKETYTYATIGRYKRLSLESDKWAKYDGKHVTLTVTPDQCWYPSQADMPIGIARLSAAPEDVLK